MPDHLSVIVPVYNEAENFSKLIAEIEQSIELPFTVITVYDFEEDDTLPVARQLAETRPWLKFVLNSKRGIANALKVGFETIPEGPALVCMADLSDDLSCVKRLRELYAAGYQVVCPSRYCTGGRQQGGPWLKGQLSRLAGLSLYWRGLPTHDCTNNFRLYDAAFVNRVGIESTGGFEIALELTAKAYRHGLKITEVPTTWRDRTAGESKFKIMAWLPHYFRWYLYALGGS